MTNKVEAAGGVLWRPASGRTGTEIALVHRPGQDDWSLPKGKLEPGEHPILGALREVAEETGSTSSLGPPLGSVEYVKGGRPKRVRYWAMRAGSGDFEPNGETDDLAWLPPDAALRLSRGRDRPVIKAFKATAPGEACPLLLVRPGRAVPQKAWQGENRDRPLRQEGVEQAAELASYLEAFGIRRLVSESARRCRDTLQPAVDELGVSLECEPDVGRDGLAADLVDLAGAGVPTVLCARQRVIDRVCDSVASGKGPRVPWTTLPRAGFHVLHVRPGGRLLRPETVTPLV